jgi:hypothetical protein
MTLSCLEAFENLKLRLISATCLTFPEVSSDVMFTVLKIEIEIVYNNIKINRLLSLALRAMPN